MHGERVRNACWGYLCQSGARELKEVNLEVSSKLFHSLLHSREEGKGKRTRNFQKLICFFLQLWLLYFTTRSISEFLSSDDLWAYSYS